MHDDSVAWERKLIEKLLNSTVKEQRAKRRWNILWKLLILTLIFYGAWTYFTTRSAEVGLSKHVALIKIDGAIAADSSASAEKIIPALKNAFAAKTAVAVVIKINSPGGSPVQADTIHHEIRRLRTKYPQKPVYVVVDEMAASGGYYIAAAADKIYVSRASIVGSIGVLINGFGFTGLMDKLGIERRLITVGDNKGFLDPFSPLNAAQKAYAESMMMEIQQQFIEVVKKGRGERLKESPEMFSGLFWTGEKAIALGLADALGTVDSVAREIVQVEDVVDYSKSDRFPELVLKRFGMSLGQGLMQGVTQFYPRYVP